MLKSCNRRPKSYSRKKHSKKKRNLKLWRLKGPPALSQASLKNWYWLTCRKFLRRWQKKPEKRLGISGYRMAVQTIRSRKAHKRTAVLSPQMRQHPNSLARMLTGAILLQLRTQTRKWFQCCRNLAIWRWMDSLLSCSLKRVMTLLSSEIPSTLQWTWMEMKIRSLSCSLVSYQNCSINSKLILLRPRRKQCHKSLEWILNSPNLQWVTSSLTRSLICLMLAVYHLKSWRRGLSVIIKCRVRSPNSSRTTMRSSLSRVETKVPTY